MSKAAPSPRRQAFPDASIRPNDRYAYLVAIVAALGGFLFGYDLTIISGAILYLKEVFQLDAWQYGFAMGSAVIGCMIGPFLISGLADRVGRKKTLFLAALLYGVSAIGTAFPSSITEFNIYRAIGGIGVALSSVVSPMYIAEISPARIRGRLVTINQLAIAAGCFAAVLVSYLLAASSLADSWRWMFASACVPAALMMAGLFLVPESPRWLIQKARVAEAMAITARLNQPSDAAAIDAAAADSSDAEDQHEAGYAELLSPRVRRALIVTIGLAVFQQLTGPSILFANAPMVIQQAGIQSASAAIGRTVMLQILMIVCTAVSIGIVDRVGRRPLLLGGLAAMIVGQVMTGIAFHAHWSPAVAVTIFFLGIGAYLMSLAPLAWLVMSELYPTSLRSKGMALASLTLWIAYFIGLQVFPLMLEYCQRNFGNISGVFYTFALLSFGALIFSWKLVPETKGRTLEEIAAALRG